MAASHHDFVVGIDYSMNSPAIAIAPIGASTFADCTIHYTDTKKAIFSGLPNIHHQSLKHQKDSPEKRFDWLSSWVTEKISPNSIVFLEGYSMGSKGTVFHIGENTGVLKHKLFNRGLSLQLVPPTTLKKFASGKGNSDKNKMFDAFVSQTGIDLFKKLKMKCPSKIGSPYSDIIDAYFLCRYGINTLNTSTTSN